MIWSRHVPIMLVSRYHLMRHTFFRLSSSEGARKFARDRKFQSFFLLSNNGSRLDCGAERKENNKRDMEQRGTTEEKSVLSSPVQQIGKHGTNVIFLIINLWIILYDIITTNCFHWFCIQNGKRREKNNNGAAIGKSLEPGPRLEGTRPRMFA